MCAQAKEASKQREKDKAAGKTVAGDVTGAVTGSGGASSSSSKADGDGKGAGGDDKEGDGAGSDDEEDGDDDGDDNGGLDPAEYSILDEDAVHAAAAVSNLLDGGAEGAGGASNMDPKRKALLSLQVEYTFTPADTAIPPIRPALWDPRMLR